MTELESGLEAVKSTIEDVFRDETGGDNTGKASGV